MVQVIVKGRDPREKIEEEDTTVQVGSVSTRSIYREGVKQSKRCRCTKNEKDKQNKEMNVK